MTIRDDSHLSEARRQVIEAFEKLYQELERLQASYLGIKGAEPIEIADMIKTVEVYKRTVNDQIEHIKTKI